MARFYTPKAVRMFSISLYYDGSPNIRTLGTYAPDWRGKQFMLGLPAPPSPSYIPDLSKNTEIVQSRIKSSDYPFVYVSSDCRISRDALRNSGFHIVRSKERANIILLPKLITTHTYDFNICCLDDNGTVTLFLLDPDDIAGITPDMITKIMDYIKSRGYVNKDAPGNEFIYDANKLSMDSIYVVPKCADFEDLWQKHDNKTKFAFEHNVVLTPSVEITPELFDVWDKCRDMDILCCALMQCNWQKYPITLAYYLRKNKSSISLYTNNAQTYILEQIGFYDLKRNGTIDKIVKPEDWNMLQKCRMHQLGVSENGGFIKVKPLDVDNKDLSALPFRIQVKPMYITEPRPYKDLVQSAENM